MLEFPHTTNEVVPLNVKADGVPVPTYQVKIVEAGALAPTAGEVTAASETDGSITGVRAAGLPAGAYDAYVKIGTRVRWATRFRLTP